MRVEHERTWGSVLLVLVGACSFGLLSTVIRLSYGAGFTPGQVVGAQVTFGGLALWGLAGVFGALRRGAVSRRDALHVILVGVPSGITGALYYGAVHALGSASLGIVLLFQFTWMGVLVEAARERRWPRFDECVAIALLSAGTVLATGAYGGHVGKLDPVGVMLGLGSAASYTAVLFGTGRVGLSVDPWLRSALVGTGALVAVFAIHPPAFLVDGSLRRGLLPYGLASGLLGPVIPTLCFTRGVPKIGTALASIVGAAELPMAMVAAHFVLGEPTSHAQWLGMLVIVAGVAYPRARVVLRSSGTFG